MSASVEGAPQTSIPSQSRNSSAIHTDESVQFHSPTAAAQARGDLRPRTAREHIPCAGSEPGKSYRNHLITGTGSKRNGRPVRGFPRIKWHFNESRVKVTSKGLFLAPKCWRREPARLLRASGGPEAVIPGLYLCMAWR